MIAQKRMIDLEVGDRWRTLSTSKWHVFTDQDARAVNADRERYERMVGRATMVEVEQ